MRIIKRKKKRSGKTKQWIEDFSDELKSTPTKSELMIRQYLEDGICGCKFQFQIPIFRYIADFLCEEHKLVIEIDGRQHRFSYQKKIDHTKDQTYKDYGYRVLRIKAEAILENIDYVLEDIIIWITENKEKGDFTFGPKRLPTRLLFCKQCKKEKEPIKKCRCKIQIFCDTCKRQTSPLNHCVCQGNPN